MNSVAENVVDKIVAHTTFRDRKRFLAVFNSLFDCIDLRGKSILDIGCGGGELAIAAIASGARSAVGLEPELEGSTDGFRTSAATLVSELHLANIHIKNISIADYDFRDGPFDIIVLYNVINHLDEAACKNLHNSSTAAEKYRLQLINLHSHLADNGTLIAADCGRRNFFGDLGLPNIIAPTIDWKLHQQPETWATLLRTAGFSTATLSWNPIHTLRCLGPFAANRAISYLTNSHFIIHAKK